MSGMSDSFITRSDSRQSRGASRVSSVREMEHKKSYDALAAFNRNMSARESESETRSKRTAKTDRTNPGAPLVPTLGPPLGERPDIPTKFTSMQQIQNGVCITILFLMLIIICALIYTGATPLSKEAFYEKYHHKLKKGVSIKQQEKELKDKANRLNQSVELPATTRFTYHVERGSKLKIPCADARGKPIADM